MSETVSSEFTKALVRPFDRAWSWTLENAVRFRFSTKPTLNSFVVRMERARRAGYATGSHEAHLFRLAAGKSGDRDKAMDWLNAAVEVGRGELQAQRAIEREIEAWDMSCRILFMVTILGRDKPRPAENNTGCPVRR